MDVGWVLVVDREGVLIIVSMDCVLEMEGV